MKARSVARELALFALFQLEKKGEPLQWDKLSLSEMILNTVRSLTLLAQEQIESLALEISQLKDYLVDCEIRHPANENIPLESPTIPVPIPTTREMIGKLEALQRAIENLQEAVYLPEMKALSERDDVQNYCRMLIKTVLAHQAEIDRRIDEAATGWRIERMQKIDLTLLRLAVGELLYAEHVDTATVIDEALDLARQYTDEESRKFIHGILGNIAGIPAGVVENV